MLAAAESSTRVLKASRIPGPRYTLKKFQQASVFKIKALGKKDVPRQTELSHWQLLRMRSTICYCRQRSVYLLKPSMIIRHQVGSWKRLTIMKQTPRPVRNKCTNRRHHKNWVCVEKRNFWDRKEIKVLNFSWKWEPVEIEWGGRGRTRG